MQKCKNIEISGANWDAMSLSWLEVFRRLSCTPYRLERGHTWELSSHSSQLLLYVEEFVCWLFWVCRRIFIIEHSPKYLRHSNCRSWKQCIKGINFRSHAQLRINNNLQHKTLCQVNQTRTACTARSLLSCSMWPGICDSKMHRPQCQARLVAANGVLSF